MTQPTPVMSRDWVALNPLSRVAGLSGVRVDYVGQGDAISILDSDGETVARIDYGGRESRPFSKRPAARRRAEIEMHLPVSAGQRIFLTHWDEDHWCSAVASSRASERARWLAPRQWTSPRAAVASARMTWVRCIPRELEGVALCFQARNGDALWCQKLDRFHAMVSDEDCNVTGLAYSLVQRDTGKVILLPGDAPLHLVPHYARYNSADNPLAGLVASHHGSRTHWGRRSKQFLSQWGADPDVTVVFSCGDPNSLEHPHEDLYRAALPRAQLVRTAEAIPRVIAF